MCVVGVVVLIVLLLLFVFTWHDDAEGLGVAGRPSEQEVGFVHHVAAVPRVVVLQLHHVAPREAVVDLGTRRWGSGSGLRVRAQGSGVRGQGQRSGVRGQG